MDGGESSAAIEVLVQNMRLNLFKEEYSLRQGLGEDAQQLQRTLAMIQGYLNDAEKKSITHDAVKLWLGELEAVAFDADNVLDELSYHLVHKKVQKMKTPKAKDTVLSCFSSFDHVARPRNMALRIKKINMAFDSINKKATDLGLHSIVVNAALAAALNASCETDSITLDPIFIGRDDDVPKLVQKLTEARLEDRIFSILAIVGMGGMGKTTLTRKVFNHHKMKAQFGSHLWVHVSQIFDPISLFKKILSVLTPDSTDGGVEGRESILKKLQEALKGKTYLLVLDNIWNEDLPKWEYFINSISWVTSTKGNGIIITTRSQKVASIVNPLEVHTLNGLSDEECWSIIKTKTFENRDVPPGFEMIGRKIANSCQGLPLAANVVGGVLQSKSEQEWSFINEKWLSDGDGGGNISKILILSFHNLASPSLKMCFAYCSVFPNGQGMEKQEVIELWMAEGFLQPDEENNMESVGRKFFDVLLHNTLLQVATRDLYGNVVSCVMHDLVHDLASTVLGSCISHSMTPVGYMVLEKKSSHIPKQVAKHLRTLFLEGEISNIMFSNLESLRNLTLSRVKELPNSIRNLIHLRNLNISKSWITELPEWIGELHHLQTIRAVTEHLWKLPSTLKYLINLRHLYVLSHVKLPAEIGRLTFIQTLRHFAVGDKKGYRIEELWSLNNLKGELHISNLEKVHDKEDALKAKIHKKPNLSELVLEWSVSREDGRNDESVLEGLQPHPNLEKLCIAGFKGKRFPLWTEKMAVRDGPTGSWIPLNNLIELRLSWCSECEEIPTLEHLPNLEYLYLKGLKKVRRLPELQLLTSLRRLDIKDCPQLSIDPEMVDAPHLTIKVGHVDDHLPSKVDDHVDDHLTNESIGSCSVEISDGGMSSAAIGVLFQNLINSFKEVDALRRGLHKDAKQLQETLRIIQSYLDDANKKSITRDDVKIWLRTIEGLAFDVDNVLDKLKYHLLHYEVNKMKTPMDKVLSSLSHMVHQPNMGLRINQINTDLDSMNERATELGLQRRVVNAPDTAAQRASFQTNEFASGPIFIGRDDNVRKLVEKLTQVPEAEMFSIYAIVGVGGIGKSMLTRKVLHDEDIKARFGSHIWVHVSQIFDPVMLLKKILSTLTSQRIDGVETGESLLKRLPQALKAKTYLLVLDDVRTEDLSKWEYFINSISGVTSTKGNAIIITTRNGMVASLMRPLHTHLLKGLSDEECWSIIKEKTFENGQVPSALEMIGRKIAKRCQGVPLAANVIGGVIRCKSEPEWHFINENWLSDGELGGENVSQILNFSYDHLPSPSVKKCFAYCSIFPKGDRIVKEELIGLWMAEGFLQPNEGDDIESVGDKIFHVLLHNSLLQIAERDNYGNVLSCVMDGLVHELASSALGSSDNSNQVRYSIQGSPIAEATEKYLRTLIFQDEVTNTNMFSGFESLHALTLDCHKVKELPSSIRKLIQLRSLNISRTRIEYLPSWISELYYLQTLNASTESLRKLPSTLKYLISLRHLYLCHDVELPAEIGRLTYLQTLRYFTVGEKKGCQIEELGSLKNLKGKLVIRNLEKVRNKAEALKAELSQKQKLSGLWFEWDEGREGERERKDESVLEGLQPHANLKNLCIRGFKGKIFPSWTLIGLKMLIEITLDSCKECEEIPKLGQLPNLKSLSLLRLSKVKSINSSFYGIANPDGGVDIFPALESVLLTDMDELREWPRIEIESVNEEEVFPRLQSLKIYLCNKLESLPSWLFNKARNLKELDIRHCSKLRQLPDDLHTLKSLESITIKGCPELESIASPKGKQTLDSLRSLEIRDCQQLKTMVESWVMPLLKRVCISELKSLENLPSFLKCLVKSPSLAQLTIVGTPKFISTSGVAIGPFHKLRKLEIELTTEWSSEISHATIQMTVDGMLQNFCSSLGELKLTGPESWECVPNSIKDLTALYSLELENSGVGELPEWFGKLQSLTRLCLYNFTQLKCLPSLQSLTTLQELHIHNCPKLPIEYEGHKIFHRCAIYFNGHQL